MRSIYWREDVEAEAWRVRARLTIGEAVGLAMRRSRFDLGMNQRDYAAKHGLSTSMLARLEAHADGMRLDIVLGALRPTVFGVVALACDDPVRLAPVPDWAVDPPVTGRRQPMGEHGSPTVQRRDAVAAEPKGHGPPVAAEPGRLPEDVRRILVDGRARLETSRRELARRVRLSEATVRRYEKEPCGATLSQLSDLLKECGHVLQLVAVRDAATRAVMPWEWPSSELVARARDGGRRFPGHRGAQPSGFLGPIWWWMSYESLRNYDSMPRWESGPHPDRKLLG